MIPIEKVKTIINAYEVLEKELASSEIDKKEFVKKSKEYSSIGEVINEAKGYVSYEKEKNELEKSNLIKCLKHDISLPLETIENFHMDAQNMIGNFLPNLKTVFFGHLGDGNLHYNVFGNGSKPDGFEGKSTQLTNKLYEIVHKYEGSFSAEHGIGQLRKESLKKHKNSVAYSIMISIKKQLDPKGIMNPGKVL